MAHTLLDTGILIRLLRRNNAYERLLVDLSAERDLYIPAFTRIEIIRGMRDHEHDKTYNLLDSFLTIPLDTPVANLTGELIRTWKLNGVTLHEADATIAATALHHDLELVTTNAKHFPMAELTVWQADMMGTLQRWIP